MGGSYQQEVDLLTLFKDVAGEYVQMIAVPEQLPNALDQAIRTSSSGRTVTALIIPADVQDMPAAELPPHELKMVPGSLGFAWPEVVPPDSELQRAADVLNEGERVAILVGQGARNAADEIVEVAGLLGAGVAKALLGKDVLSDDLPFVSPASMGERPPRPLRRVLPMPNGSGRVRDNPARACKPRPYDENHSADRAKQNGEGYETMSDLQAVADRVEIEALRGEYTDAVMMRDYDRFASLFTEDGAMRWPHINKEFLGREEIRAAVAQGQGLWDYFVQTTHPGTIQVEGDIATGRAYIAEFGRFREGSSHLNYAVYHDRYERTPDGWKFAERLYEIKYVDTSPLAGSAPHAPSRS